jgi:protein-S-isoprenylcysteine O-methyltransferase Ste14
MLALAAFVFIPAWTFDYWQAWVFMAVFACVSAAIVVYLAIHNPQLLESRINMGPQAEKEPSQKVIMLLLFFEVISMVVFAGIDYRMKWSPVPESVSVMGDALMVAGLLLIFVVLRANPYSASTIRVVEHQAVISTGPYARVRHPMYAGKFVMFAGVPIALCSWWGLFAIPVIVITFIFRLFYEERLLAQKLSGYTEYQAKVKYRLIPFIW